MVGTEVQCRHQLVIILLLRLGKLVKLVVRGTLRMVAAAVWLMAGEKWIKVHVKLHRGFGPSTMVVEEQVDALLFTAITTFRLRKASTKLLLTEQRVDPIILDFLVVQELCMRNTRILLVI